MVTIISERNIHQEITRIFFIITRTAGRKMYRENQLFEPDSPFGETKRY